MIDSRIDNNEDPSDLPLTKASQTPTIPCPSARSLPSPTQTRTIHLLWTIRKGKVLGHLHHHPIQKIIINKYPHHCRDGYPDQLADSYFFRSFGHLFTHPLSIRRVPTTHPIVQLTLNIRSDRFSSLLKVIPSKGPLSITGQINPPRRPTLFFTIYIFSQLYFFP